MSIERKRLSDYVDMCLDGDRVIEDELLIEDEIIPITTYVKKYDPLLGIFYLMKSRLASREEKIARFYLGIPEDLTEEDIENDKEFELGFIRTLRETAEEFNLSVERVRTIIWYKLFRGYHFRRKRISDYLD